MPNTVVAEMWAIEVLGLFVVGGLIGGFLGGIAAVDSREMRAKIYPTNIYLFFISRSLIGAGAAIAVLLVIIFAGRFKSEQTVVNQLWFFALSLVAGFVGYRLLPNIARGLEVELDRLSKEQQQTTEKVEEVEKKATEVETKTALAEAISAGGQALSLGNEADLNAAIELLIPQSSQFPTHRLVHIYLGRIYRRLRRYGQAIDVLSRFIDRKIKAGEGDDKDISAAYYNRACYYLLRSQNLKGEEAETIRLKELMYKDLEKAIGLDPESGMEAAEDDDFKPVYEEARFKQITTGRK